MRSQKRKLSEQAVLRCRAQDDPHDEIAADVLALWIDISRLLAKIRGGRDVGLNDIVASPKQRQKEKRPPANRKPGRKAA